MAELEVKTRSEKNPDCLVLELIGSLDLFTFNELKSAFDQLPADNSTLRVAVDLTGVSYVASSGWGVLMSYAKAQKARGGMLIIFGLNAGNKNVYETLHIASIMPLADNFKQTKGLLKKKSD